MEYIKVIYYSIILWLKKIMKKGNWDVSFIQDIHPFVKITTNANSFFKLAKHVIIERYGNIFIGKNAILKIGTHTYFNQGMVISCQKEIKIGEGCLFGPSVKIYDNNHKFSKDMGVSYEFKAESISIGDHCWIASNVVILKGTHIGKNCVIGANCVVSGIIPDNTIIRQKDNLIIEEMREN